MDKEVLCFKKIALFDFDGTLVDFDTVNSFIRYVLKKHPECDVPPDLSLPHKEFRLKLLKGLKEEDLETIAKSYYKAEIRPHLIPDVLEVMNDLKMKGYRICIVSGSYKIYLNCFCEEFQIDDLICTDIDFLDGRCLGGFIGIDCIGFNKLLLLKKKFGVSNFKAIDSIAFSDSESDIPLLNSCRQACIVVPRSVFIKRWMKKPDWKILNYKLSWRTILYRKAKWHIKYMLGKDD